MSAAPPRSDAPSADAFEEMTALAGLEPQATFTLIERDIKGGAGLPPALAAFLTSIKMSKAA